MVRCAGLAAALTLSSPIRPEERAQKPKPDCVNVGLAGLTQPNTPLG